MINFDMQGTSKLWPEINNLSEEDLLLLRSQIDQRLPARSLSDLDLETELILQFQTVKALMNDVIQDEEIPANQKAQVANSCASILAQMTKMQTELYNAERIKAIEQALIETLKGIDEEKFAEFTAKYEEIYRKLA